MPHASLDLGGGGSASAVVVGVTDEIWSRVERSRGESVSMKRGGLFVPWQQQRWGGVDTVGDGGHGLEVSGDWSRLFRLD